MASRIARPQPYDDRQQAGAVLARRLERFKGRNDVVVLALPRGGVPVAHEVARALGAPLDVFLVRTLGVPGHRELAMGAIASGGVRFVNDDVVRAYTIPEAAIGAGAHEEQVELERREGTYREGRPPVESSRMSPMRLSAPARRTLSPRSDSGIATSRRRRTRKCARRFACISSARRERPEQRS